MDYQEKTPEDAFRVVAQEEKIQAIPVFLYHPDKILIGGELFCPALHHGKADIPSPQVIRYQVAEITQSKGDCWLIIPTPQRQEVSAVEIQVSGSTPPITHDLEMGDLGRRVEVFPFFIRDTGIGSNVAD